MSLWTKALAAWQGNDPGVARKLLTDLLAISPGDLSAKHLYGVVSMETGDFDAAIEHLEHVCNAEPGNLEALLDLVNAQRLAGQLKDAEATLRSTISRRPNNADLHFNLGIVLLLLKQSAAAEVEFLQAVELQPTDQAAWLQLGLCRYSRSDHVNAATAFLHAAELDGEDKAQARRLAGFAFADGGRFEQAERLLASLCSDRPQDTEDFHLLSQLLFCRLELCDWRQIPEIIDRCKQFIAEGRAPLEPFTFLLLPDITAQEQLALTASFVRDMPVLGVVLEVPEWDMNPLRRLRIGYLSADFHDHAVMRLLAGVLERHDHGDFEIHAFSYGGPDNGEMRRRIVAACDLFHDVSGLPPESMADRIRAEAIDILIDLTGWTGNTKSAVLKFRSAPIQVNWLGYTGTLGSDALVDYLIGDPIATPLSHQRNFAERLALLPVCCQPNDADRRIGNPRTRAEEGLPENGFVYCCFSRPLKITSQVFRVWCDLLVGVPESVLWLLDTNNMAKTNLVAAAKAYGVDASRLVFSPAVSLDQHLARLSLADLALDTFPFGAHTTASDALWAGVPVVTILGETFPSRVTASILNAVGLNSLTTHSLGEYRTRAIDLARNTDLMTSIRNQLEVNRVSSHLFDTDGFAVELEALLKSMWQRHCEMRLGAGNG